jgi:hypothetical protein
MINFIKKLFYHNKKIFEGWGHDSNDTALG